MSAPKITAITTIDEWDKWDGEGMISHPERYANRWFEAGEPSETAIEAAADFWGASARLVIARVADDDENGDDGYLIPAVWVPYLLDGSASLTDNPRCLDWHGVRVTHRALVDAKVIPDEGLRASPRLPTRDD